MRVSEFDYHLPEELIAQKPSKIRDLSRLLILDRKTGKIEHCIFRDIGGYLKPNDLLVLNDTKVIPARLLGKKSTGAKIEVLLLSPVRKNIWEALVRPGKRLKVGSDVLFGKGRLKARVLEKSDSGVQVLKFSYKGRFDKVLSEIGSIPLPPYIKCNLKNKNRYQTIYAKTSGASAAPTAGLHFTGSLLEKLKKKGIKITHIALHTGFSTFRPVWTKEVEDHKMHAERYIISKESAEAINTAKKCGGRVIAVGTTAVRAIESAAKGRKVFSKRDDTDLFIYSGYKFKIVDAIITNFHFPRSTLLMLVSAFASKEFIFKAYRDAIKRKYRLFSFGDAMLIV